MAVASAVLIPLFLIGSCTGRALIEDSAATYVERRSCFTCHHQALPAMTVALAREHGYEVDDERAEGERFTQK